jgi:hypothetical protein
MMNYHLLKDIKLSKECLKNKSIYFLLPKNILLERS